MQELDNLSAILRTFSENIANGISRLAIAIILMLVGWVLARFITKIVTRLLHSIRADDFGNYIKSVDLFSRLEFKLSEVIGKIIYWLIIVVFFTAATEALGLSSIAEGIQNLLAYMPKVLSATVFFVAGALAANMIKTIIDAACSSMGVPTGRVISTFVFYFLIVMISITSLNQAGLDTQVLTQNVSIASAAIFFAFALAYGFASRDILANLLASFYSKDKFSVGQRIRIDGIEGVIERIDSTSVTLSTADSEVIMSLQRLINSTVEVLK